MDKSYLKYSKTQLINLNYSLNKELLRTSRNGGYSSSTIIGCNTRKYHGMLVTPQKDVDGGRHVLLSNVDETLVIKDSEFHLSARIFPNGYIFPKGHKYLRDFNSEPNMKLSYRIGKTIFNKEYIFVEKQSRLLLKYTLEDTLVDELCFRISPLLAYRSIHSLTRSNLDVNNKFEVVDKGVSWRMYEGYSRLFFQVSKVSEYIHNPDWHYDIEYPMEREHGFECNEDLFVPGFFDIKMKKGESVVISIGLEEKVPSGFKRAFTEEINKRSQRNSFENCLKNASDQFLIKRHGRKEIIAGYHWFGRWGRDSFIALPGICLTDKDESNFHDVMKYLIGELKDGNFANVIDKESLFYNAADTPFWFFRTLHKLFQMTKGNAKIWESYGPIIKKILEAIRTGDNDLIHLHENGLIWTKKEGTAISWMDAYVDGKPANPREGYLVEINALWYDALCLFINLAEKAEDKAFLKKWQKFPEKVRLSFVETFWDEKKGYLADYVNEQGPNWDIRPNMIFAVSEPFSPVSEYQKEYVVKKIKDKLLTPRGLRTLSPENNRYIGKYEGDQGLRDKAYHQGTVWPWLMGAFAEAYLKLHRKTGKTFIEMLYKGFEDEMQRGGIGTISEIYDGNPPYENRGAISHAGSVAEIRRIKWLLENTDRI